MFTGIVQGLGLVAALEAVGEGARLEVSAPDLDFRAVALGHSIAVNGVCLTVAQREQQGFVADLSAETLSRTTLGGVQVGDAVNLELALAAGAPLGGHFVTGHVDAVAEVVARHDGQQSIAFDVQLPGVLCRYTPPKASICLDGVSLTINAVTEDRLRLDIIPHTAQATILGHWRRGTTVNVEVDLIARYLEQLMGIPR